MEGAEPTPFLLGNGLETVETSRLHLRRLAPEHFAQLRAMDADPVVMATLGGVRSVVETEQSLAANLAHWETIGFGIWMAFTREDGRFVGRGGLRTVSLPDGPTVEIAYALRRDLWGRGYATEIAQASIAAAGAIGLHEAYAFTLVTNTASERVMQKIGMTYLRVIDWANEPHVLYRCSLPVASEERPGERRLTIAGRTAAASAPRSDS